MSITVSLDRYKELVWNNKTPENIEKRKAQLREETLQAIERGEIIVLDDSMSIESMVKSAQEGDTTDIPAYVLEEGFAERVALVAEKMNAQMVADDEAGLIPQGYDCCKLKIVNDGYLWQPTGIVGSYFFNYTYNAEDETVTIFFRPENIFAHLSTMNYINSYEKAYNYIEELAAKIEADESKGIANPYSKDIIDIFKRALNEAFVAKPCLAIFEQTMNAGLSIPKAEEVSLEFSEQFVAIMENLSEDETLSIKDIARAALLSISSKFGMNFSLAYKFADNLRYQSLFNRNK